MPLSRRYSPEWSPGDTATIGMDFSYVLPPGVGIASNPSLSIWSNFAQPVDATATDWNVLQSPLVVGRAVYAIVHGGQPGIDYQFRWNITDTLGNVWTRTGLLLVGLTS